MSILVIISAAYFLAYGYALPNTHREQSAKTKPGICPDEQLFGYRNWANLDEPMCDIDADCTGSLKCCKFYGTRRCLPDARQVTFDRKIDAVPMKEENKVRSANQKQVVTVCSDVCEWGDWHSYEVCTAQAYVMGFNAKIQQNQGPKDDTALNGIAFVCGYRNGSSGQNIYSGVGQWGQWDQPTPLKCASGTFVTGFQLIYEPSCGLCDDTAAGGVRVQCSDGNAMELLIAWQDSKFSPWYRCPDGLAVNGISTQIEGSNSIDDTAMNNMCIQCASLP